MAAGLARSVASSSRGHWDEAGGAIAQAEAIQRRVTPLIVLDARAYAEARDSLAGRGGTAAGERDQRMAETLEDAAAIPLEICEAAADAAELSALVAEHADPNIRADAAAATTLAEGAAQVGVILVEINLGTLRDDSRLTRAHALAGRAAHGRERAARVLGS
jgi:formiminotetrahydrofolate cyclodeaminase